MTLQDLLDFCLGNNMDPKECEIVLREECSNGDFDMEFLTNPRFHKGEVKIPDEGDTFIKIPVALSLQKKDYPDEF